MNNWTVAKIISEIKEAVRDDYYGHRIEISEKAKFGEFEQIIELVAFIFEGYRNEFDQIKRRDSVVTITENILNVERIIIISWISLELLNEFRNADKLIRVN